MLNPCLVHSANNSQSRLIPINTVGHDQTKNEHAAALHVAWCYGGVNPMTALEKLV